MLDILLDVLGELLGLGGEEPPGRQQQQRQRQPQTPQPAQPNPGPGRRQQREGKPARKASARKAPETLSAPALTAAAEALPEPAPAATQPAQFDFIAALRSNPDAARQAFVYSEIFGKPLADRGSSF